MNFSAKPRSVYAYSAFKPPVVLSFAGCTKHNTAHARIQANSRKSASVLGDLSVSKISSLYMGTSSIADDSGNFFLVFHHVIHVRTRKIQLSRIKTMSSNVYYVQSGWTRTGADRINV